MMIRVLYITFNCGMTLSLSLSTLIIKMCFDSMGFWRPATASILSPPPPPNIYVRVNRQERETICSFMHWVSRFCSELVILYYWWSRYVLKREKRKAVAEWKLCMISRGHLVFQPLAIFSWSISSFSRKGGVQALIFIKKFSLYSEHTNHTKRARVAIASSSKHFICCFLTPCSA